MVRLNTSFKLLYLIPYRDFQSTFQKLTKFLFNASIYLFSNNVVFSIRLTNLFVVIEF